MQDYIVTFTIGDIGVTPRAFASLLGDRVPGLTRFGTGWQFGTSLRLLGKNDDIFRLSADATDLYRFLSAVFDVPAHQKTAVTFAQPESSETVVVIHNDAGQLADRLEMANMRFVDAEGLLMSFDVFQVTFQNLFRDIDGAADPDAAYHAVIPAPVARFLLNGFTPVTPDTETARLVVEEDFETFSFQVRPISLNGRLRAAFTLTYAI